MALSLPTSYISMATASAALPAPIRMSEVPPDFYKGSANRAQSSSLELPRCSLTYAKAVQTECNQASLNCRGAAWLMQRQCKPSGMSLLKCPRCRLTSTKINTFNVEHPVF